MKRVFPAIVLLILCIGICVYGSIATENKTKALLNMLNEAEYAINIGEKEGALSSIRRVEEEWERAERFFSSVSETALLDEIDLSLGSIEKHIEADMNDEATVVIEQCRIGLETILRRQKLSLDNIL
ncbi:MAG: DUF4363 family protein [Ruminococcaceae bacterium]|nr:DUF4363 family protein [Oscillospiraceae bacterium]